MAPTRQREPEHDVQAEDVEHGQDAVHHVVAVHVPLRAHALGDVGTQIPVREHRRAWGARGPAREQEDGEMIGVDIEALDGFGLEQPLERDQLAVAGCGRIGGDDAGDGGNGRRVDVRPGRRARPVDHHERRSDRRDLLREFRRGARGVERDDGRAEAERREIGDDERNAVGQHECDAVAVTDAERGEPAAEVFDLRFQLAVGGGAVVPDQRRGVGRVVVDDLGKIHRPPRETLAPDLSPAIVTHGHPAE